MYRISSKLRFLVAVCASSSNESPFQDWQDLASAVACFGPQLELFSYFNELWLG